MASCRPGAFAFLWGGFGSCWPEAIPRCRSPPPSFRSLVNQQPKRRSIWLLSICGTITRSIHRIASWKYRKKLQKCSKSLIVKRLLIGCVHTATKPTIPSVSYTHLARAAHRPACPHAPHGRCGADEREIAMVSLYPLWKADDHTGQPRRGKDLLCHASCGGLHQPKALARYGNP